MFLIFILYYRLVFSVSMPCNFMEWIFSAIPLLVLTNRAPLGYKIYLLVSFTRADVKTVLQIFRWWPIFVLFFFVRSPSDVPLHKTLTIWILREPCFFIQFFYKKKKFFFFFWVSVYTISSRNNASILNFSISSSSI